MRKYFYNLSFSYAVKDSETEEIASSRFNIGYFSTVLEAQKIINKLKDKPGFCAYTIENFKIRKCAANFKKDLVTKNNVSVYVLTHEFMTEDYAAVWTDFGIFGDKLSAMAELNRQKQKKKYKEHIEGFDISKWRVDKDIQWQEGFSHEEN